MIYALRRELACIAVKAYSVHMANMVPLADISDVSQGAVLSRISNENGESRSLIQVSNVEALSLVGSFEKVSVDIPASARYEAAPDQILLTQRGDKFDAATIQPEHAGFVIGSNIAIITPDLERVEPMYLAGLLNSKAIQQYLDRFTGGGAARSISIRQMRDFEIPLIGLDEQRVIGQAFDAYRRAKLATRTLLEAQRERLDQIVLPLVEGAYKG